MKKTTMKKWALLLAFTSFSALAEQTYSEMIEYPFYEVQKTSEGKNNKMMILNSGVAAFWKRIEMIRSAKKNIEVEYFIYSTDETSKALTTELVKAAERGVIVRILVDKSAAVFELDPFYAKALKTKGVELRYYNAAPLYRISSVNFRNHRKLISVDDRYAITGGRNIENDYFDYSTEFNFLDRDAYIEGDIVPTLRKSFDAFFENSIVETPSDPQRPKETKIERYKEHGSVVTLKREVPNTKKINEYENKIKNAEAFISESDDSKILLEKYRDAAAPILANSKLISCPEITYSTDRPGGDFLTRLVEDYSDDYRYLRKTLFDKAITVDKGIIVSSPYMINSPKSLEIYQSLLDKGVSIDLYTNSMASTDALYVAANLYRSVFSWARSGIKTYIHAGEYIDESSGIVSDVAKAKWGTHSKTQLYIYKDATKNEFMIGTYNYDNRSNHYNTEMGIFCKGSTELYDIVEESVKSRMNEGYLITEDHKAFDKNGKEVSVFGANKDDLLKMAIYAIPSWLLSLLL